MRYGLAYEQQKKNMNGRAEERFTFNVYSARGHSLVRTVDRSCSEEEPNLGLWLLSMDLGIEVSAKET